MDDIRESQIVDFWRYLLWNGTELTTEDGIPIRIIYPGRINDDQGADFRDAVIAADQGLIMGDIEIHIKSSDWRAHRHHRDAQYNRVILQVVMKHDSKRATDLQNGRSVPALALDKYTEEPNRQWLGLANPSVGSNTPCFGCSDSLTADSIREFLDSGGAKRFWAKAARFEASIAQMGASQSLYQGIMTALGYYKNKLPFLELARRLPLRLLESMTQDNTTDEEYLARQQALLLGTAGLLPSQRHNWHQDNKSDDRWVDSLEKLWVSFCPTEAMPPDAWHLFRIRPTNSPVRRLMAMSHLLLRYKDRGILEEVINVVKEAPLSKGHHRLEAALVVATNGYWASHFDFASRSRIPNPSLLGRGRAADIAVNVLLPFTFAWSKRNSQPELKCKSFDLYRSYPRLSGNTVEQHMIRQIGLDSSLVNSAQRQQGLIHIYETLCTQGKCRCCRLAT